MPDPTAADWPLTRPSFPRLSVCTTELGETARLLPEFEKRGVKVLGLSCEGVESHKGWVEDIKAFNKLPSVGFPIIADEDRTIARLFGMLRADDEAAGPVRSLYLFNPDKKVALVITYPSTCALPAAAAATRPRRRRGGRSLISNSRSPAAHAARGATLWRCCARSTRSS